MKYSKIQLLSIDSQAIRKVLYNYSDETLKIQFNSRDEYEYEQVPHHVFEGLQNSPSQGRFLNRYILKQFNYKKL
jgi:hypothetical protein